MRRLLTLLICWPLLLGAASRSFDGANDEIDFGANLDVTTNDMSLCAWWKGTEDASADFILGKKGGLTTAAGYNLHQSSADINAHNVSDGVDLVTSVGTDTDAAWVFLCGTWTASTEVTVLFENGVQVDTDTGAGAVGSLTNAANLQIGEDSGDANDANGLVAYGLVNRNIVATVVQVNEMMWFPERCGVYDVSGFWPLWGASTEQDLAGGGVTGTVSGTGGTSEDGPPVMFGEGLPI